MGKQGPCCHCGVTSTPLWRNGPPEKPVLCNACGSRWRTKGTLMNYTPLHARQFVDPEESSAHRAPKVKIMTCKHNEQKMQKKKQPVVIHEIEHETPYCGQNFHKAFREDTSNRSSSGSVVSCSESYAQVGNTDGNDMTASEQSNAWDSLVPTHKRICIPCPKPSPVEKLRKDLYSILCEQQSSNISEISDGDLLYEITAQTGSVEIGHGGVLIRPPNLELVEEESEASSFPLDNKSCRANEAYSRSVLYSARTDSKGPRVSSVVAVKIKKPTEGVAGEHVKRDKSSRRKLRVLRDRHSPLCCINLGDIISFETFTGLLSNTEQEQLMKFLPPVDTAKAQMSLKSMFDSEQFLENFHCFQQLLLEGVFDLSFLGPKLEECKILKKHVLSDVKKARWLDQYKHMKDLKVKQNSGGNGFNIPEHINSVRVKGPHAKQGQSHAVVKQMTRGLKRKFRPAEMVRSSKTKLNSSDSASSLRHSTDALTGNEVDDCFSPQTIFASPVDHSSMLASLQFTDTPSEASTVDLWKPMNTCLPSKNQEMSSQ